MNEKKYDVVVGIDFGSSGCGFAYSFMNEKDIIHGLIKGANTENKVPNEIILDENGNILEFGANCSQYLVEKGVNIGHYFKGIKMLLYDKKTIIKANNTGKTFSLSIVIQKILEKIKTLSEDILKNLGQKLDTLNIKWVVTIPAIWGEFQKGIMMEACLNSGLIKENDDKSLFFALEPEAASLYCSRDKNINPEYLNQGKYYIICDLGGGTGDIVFHLVGNNKNLEEISVPCGGNYGSNEIDKYLFEDLVNKIFGFKDFESLYMRLQELNIKEKKETIFDEWCELERKIKQFKESVNFGKVNENVKFPINFNIFQECFKNENENFEYLINKYNNKYNSNSELKLEIVSNKKWLVDCPYKIIYNYIEKQAKLIAEQINNNLKISNKDIDTIIFVGGYSSNEILISSIKKYLDKKIIHHLQPSTPYLAIMNGAVLFGINPYIINSRIAKYTIGQKVRNIWDEKIHSKFSKSNKVYDKNEKVYRCINCFDKFIEVGQKIKYEQEITKSYSMVGERYCNLIFYKTLSSNPILITEEGVEEIGICKLDAGQNYPFGERDITVTLKFGGTFIDVKGKHVKSGKEVKANFKFN